MPRFPKGSAEAKEWGLKMKEMRNKKKVGSGIEPCLKMEHHGDKARRGRKPISISGGKYSGGWLQAGEQGMQKEFEGGSISTRAREKINEVSDFLNRWHRDYVIRKQ